MTVLIVMSVFLTFGTFADLKSFSSDTCLYSRGENLEDNKYDKLLSYLDRESYSKKRKDKKIKGNSKGKQ
ncbi:MAG: hypothetical protein ACR2M7_03590 [Bdellovibrionales bacterium]